MPSNTPLVAQTLPDTRQEPLGYDGRNRVADLEAVNVVSRAVSQNDVCVPFARLRRQAGVSLHSLSLSVHLAEQYSSATITGPTARASSAYAN